MLYKPATPSNPVHLAARRDAPVVCARCGRSVPRQARQQKFCSDICRERSRERTRKAAVGATKNGARYPTTGAPANPPKNVNGFKSLPTPKTGSSLLHNAIETEIFGNRTWRRVMSSGGVASEVSTWRRRTLVGDPS